MQIRTIYIYTQKCYNAAKAQKEYRIMYRRMLALLIILLLLVPAAQAQTYRDIPDCLRISQTSEKIKLSSSAYQLCYYPDTCQEAVDQELKTLIDDIALRLLPHVPAKPGNPQTKSYIDAGASIFRTGESWASFLLTGCVADNRKQLAVEMDARAYDMATGERLMLSDIVTPQGYSYLQQEAVAQLSAYFPQFDCDTARLDALLNDMEAVPFTFNAVFLSLHFRADALYDNQPTLMHVSVPYSALAPYLTEEAQKQFDNSQYKMVVLTYDDGPDRTHTLSIARALRMGAANATFFIVGDRIPYGPELVAFMHDAGFSVGSHNYSHTTEAEARYNVQKHRALMDEAVNRVIGRAPTIMRVPGGGVYVYVLENVNLPLINWSLVAREDLDRYIDPKLEARRLSNIAQDGDIILMHDLREVTDNIAQHLAAAFAEKNFLCVTVEELFAARGVTLENNIVYLDARPAE